MMARMNMRKCAAGRGGPMVGAIVCACLMAGCNNRADMVDQPRVEADEPSPFFEDGASARPYVAGTVPRTDDPMQPVFSKTPPPQPPLSTALLARGQERFDIYCSMCHGRDGYGHGMVVQRGFPQAASYHTDRLRSVSDRHIYDVITNGYKNMPAYGFKVPPKDRWAIIAYVRALQLSQHARLADLPAQDRQAVAARAEASKDQ